MQLNTSTRISIQQALCFLVLAFALLPNSSALSKENNWLDDAAEEILGQHDSESILIIGELHGSRETPAITSAIVRKLSLSAPVTVGLEIPNQEQSRVDRFLASDGSQEAVAELLRGDFWQVAPERSDGRRSAAILELIDSLRRISTNAHPPEIVLLDDPNVAGSADDRRLAMANRIAGLADRLDHGSVVILIGNYHARLTPNSGLMMSNGKPIEPPKPTASLIEGVPLTSLNVSACRGEIWACFAETCGPFELTEQCTEKRSADLTKLDPKRDGYHVSVMLPKHSLSPPASSP